MEEYYGEDYNAAKRRAEELNKAYTPTDEDFARKAENYFNERIGFDEVLLGTNHIFGNDNSYEEQRFLESEFNYTRVTETKEYTNYFVRSNAEKEYYTSGYSGTVSSDGNVSLSPDIEESNITTYTVCDEQKTKEFIVHYKVLKKKDVEEVKKAESEVGWNRQRYEDVTRANGKVSDWKEVSPIAFFFKYGLAPFVLIIMMAFAALLFPRFDLSLPWMSEEPPYFWTLLRRTRLYTLSPYIAVAALVVAMVSTILLLVIKSKVSYRFMYDRYMEWYKWFFWRMFAAACCVLLAFLLGMIPEKVNADGVIAELILGLVRWIGVVLANISWIAAFVLLIINLWAIVRRGFGIALAIDINDRVWDLQSYVEQGEYAKDKESIKKIKNYTVKKTSKNFLVPQNIDFTDC